MPKTLRFTKPADRKLGLLLDDEQVKDQITKWEEEDFEKLDKLCEIYKIIDGPDKYKYLALELARKLFPELKKKGRVKKWEKSSYACLYVEVKRITEIDKEEDTIEKACLCLAKKKVWNNFMQDGLIEYSIKDIAENLRKRYYQARKSVDENNFEGKWCKVMFDAFSYHEYKGDRNGWFEHIAFILEGLRGS